MSSVIKVDAIQNQSGTSAMTINNSGSVSLSIGPSFLLKQTGVTTYGSGSYNEIIKSGIHEVLHDSDSACNSDGVFTVPTGKGGVYMFNWGASMMALGNGNYLASSLKIDGSTDSSTEAYFYNSLANFPFRIAQMVKLNAGQTVIPQMFHANGSTLSDDGNGGRKGFFGGFRVG